MPTIDELRQRSAQLFTTLLRPQPQTTMVRPELFTPSVQAGGERRESGPGPAARRPPWITGVRTPWPTTWRCAAHEAATRRALLGQPEPRSRCRIHPLDRVTRGIYPTAWSSLSLVADVMAGWRGGGAAMDAPRTTRARKGRSEPVSALSDKTEDFDGVVVGSGFGAAVIAYRL